MGWDSWHATCYKNGRPDVKSEIRNYFNCDGYSLLRLEQKGSTYYAAVKHPKGHVFGCVVLTSVDSKDYFNVSKKLVDETMGPYENGASEKLIAMLSPIENEFALRWRKDCLERSKQDKKYASLLKSAETISITVPVDLQGYDKGAVVTLRRYGKSDWTDGIYRWKNALLRRLYGRDTNCIKVKE